MWRRWTLFCATLLQDKSLQRLLIAVAISLVLHLFLLGKFYLSLPSLDDAATHFLTAELVSTKPIKAEPVKPENLAKKSPKELIKTPVKAAELTKTEPEQTTEAESNAQIQENEALEPSIDAENEPLTSTQIVMAQPEMSVPDNSTDLAVEINQQAYQYVETTFDVRTDIEADLKSSPAGRAKIVYQLLPNNAYYQIDSLMEAQGLASLFISDLVQKSTGSLTDKGLRPNNFLYKYGNNAEKTYQATFDWDNDILKLQTAKVEKQVPLEKGAQDLLSFMYQFMFIPPLSDMSLNITNGKKLSQYEYSFEGEAIIFSKMGDIKTIHIARSNADNDDKIELWLALDYQYVPVKIRKTEKNGKVYELLVTSLKTTKPDQSTNPQ